MATIDHTSSGTITTAFSGQLVSAANSARTYWLFQHIGGQEARMWLGIGANPSSRLGTILLGTGESIDSSAVPELTQAAVYVYSDTAGAEFTFLEVA